MIPTSSSALPPPPPPQEIILQVYMHCEACACQIRCCLRDFPGVEGVITNSETRQVVVKGEKADPLEVLKKVQRTIRRQVELLSPIPKPPSEEDKIQKKPEEEKPKPEEKKEEPQVITVILEVHMHCEACPQRIKKCIRSFKGVEYAEPDLKSSQVTVKGAFDPAKLVEYVYKETGKRGVIVKQEPEKKEEKAEERNKKDQKKGERRAIVKQEPEKEEKKAGEPNKKDQKKGERRAIVKQEPEKKEKKAGERNKKDQKKGPPRVIVMEERRVIVMEERRVIVIQEPE